jgi:hypothetical protein
MKKTIQKLKTVLESGLKGKVKGFYIGDPWLFPESVMPCIVIAPIRTEVDALDNQRDKYLHIINVSLIVDARQYFDATPNTMVGTIFLMDTMEGETAAGAIDNKSILGLVRANLNLESNRFIENISNVDYTVRRRSEELITLECSVELQITYAVNR